MKIHILFLVIIFALLNLSNSLENDDDLNLFEDETVDSSIEKKFIEYTNVQKEIMDSKEAHLVFYHNGLPDSDEETTNFLQLMNSINDKFINFGINVGVVDCKDKLHKKQCKTNSFTQLPSLDLYTDSSKINPYTHKQYRASNKFDGSINDMKRIERFVSKSYPTHINRLEDDVTLSDFNNLLENENKLPLVVLFSEKKQTSMLMKSISFNFKSNFRFVEVSHDSKEITSKYNINTFPSIVVINESVNKYDNIDMTRPKILEWLSNFVQKIVEEENNTDDVLISNIKGSKIFSHHSVFSMDEFSNDFAWLLAVVNNDASEEISDWSKVSKWCEGSIKSSELRCSSATNLDTNENNQFGADLCKQSLPYIIMIPHGENSRKTLIQKNFPSKWKNNIFKADDILKAKNMIADSFPDDLVTVFPESMLNEFIGRGLKDGVLSIINLSPKSSPASVLRNVALTMKPYANIGFLSNPSKQLMDGIGNIALPAIIMARVKHNEEDGSDAIQISPYDPTIFGSFSYRNIEAFIQQTYVASGLTPKSEKERNENVENMQEPDSHFLLPFLYANNEWNNQCPPEFRGICVIGFYPTDYVDMVESMNKVRSRIDKSALLSLKFMISDINCYPSWAEKFGLQVNNVPTVVAYSPFKSRYATFKGSFSENAAYNFIHSVIGGTIVTSPLSERPIMGDKCEDNIEVQIDEEYIEESSEDMEEFLKEIKKEEEEKKKKLKDELAEEKKRLKEEKIAKELEEAEALKKSKKSKKKKSKKSKKSEL